MSTDDNQFRRVDWSGDQPLPSDDDDEHGMPLQPPRGPGLAAADLELLTLAARALGATVEVVEGEQWVVLHFDDGTTAYGWNPLRHSDDTLDLSVRLRITIDHSWKTKVRVEWLDGYTPLTYHVDCTDADRKAATSRAITRAAAEIGKAMA